MNIGPPINLRHPPQKRISVSASATRNVSLLSSVFKVGTFHMMHLVLYFVVLVVLEET